MIATAIPLEERVRAVPDELKARRQWVRFTLGDPDPDTGKRSKFPWHPTLDYRVSVAKPWQWGTFDQVLGNLGHHGTVGVGYVFAKVGGYGRLQIRDKFSGEMRNETDEEYQRRLEALAALADPYTGIDLDDSVSDAGTLAPWAAAFVKLCASYTEYSVSFTGVHLIVRGCLEGAGIAFQNKPKGIKVEAYSRGRFFTMSGDPVPDAPAVIVDAQKHLDELVRVVRAQKPARGAVVSTTASGKVDKGRHDFLLKNAARLLRDGVQPAVVLSTLKVLRDEVCAEGGRPVTDPELERMVRWNPPRRPA